MAGLIFTEAERGRLTALAESAPWETIRQQIGRRALFMLGAKNLVHSNGGKTLSFNIGRNAKSINWIRITLMPSDTYKFEFGRGRKNPRVVNTVNDVHFADMHKVIEDNTGLRTSL